MTQQVILELPEIGQVGCQHFINCVCNAWFKMTFHAADWPRRQHIYIKLTSFGWMNFEKFVHVDHIGQRVKFHGRMS